MIKKISNTKYYLREVSTLLKRDLSTNILSTLSLGFIFFIISLVISLGISSQFMIDEISSQAQISIYYNENFDPNLIKDELKIIPGVNVINYINSEEANARMQEVLGSDKRILELFDHNPFSPYLEVFIELDQLDEIVQKSKDIHGVELVRDNQEVLDKLKNLLNILTVLGVFIFIAISVATLVITAHIIRQGVYINKEAIATLKLLGAPSYFIYIPFVINGIFMTLLAGIGSVVLVYFSNSYIYSKISGVLPFIILPKFSALILTLVLFNGIISIILGFLGSILGIKTTKLK